MHSPQPLNSTQIGDRMHEARSSGASSQQAVRHSFLSFMQAALSTKQAALAFQILYSAGHVDNN